MLFKCYLSEITQLTVSAVLFLMKCQTDVRPFTRVHREIYPTRFTLLSPTDGWLMQTKNQIKHGIYEHSAVVVNKTSLIQMTLVPVALFFLLICMSLCSPNVFVEMIFSKNSNGGELWINLNSVCSHIFFVCIKMLKLFYYLL